MAFVDIEHLSIDGRAYEAIGSKQQMAEATAGLSILRTLCRPVNNQVGMVAPNMLLLVHTDAAVPVEAGAERWAADAAPAAAVGSQGDIPAPMSVIDAAPHQSTAAIYMHMYPILLPVVILLLCESAHPAHGLCQSHRLSSQLDAGHHSVMKCPYWPV